MPAQQAVAMGTTHYLHGDLIDSTVLTTDNSGSSVSSVGYTAFGERVVWDEVAQRWVTGGPARDGFPRYQYAAGWGYGSGGFSDDPGGPGGTAHLLALYGPRGTAIGRLQGGFAPPGA